MIFCEVEERERVRKDAVWCQAFDRQVALERTLVMCGDCTWLCVCVCVCTCV